MIISGLRSAPSCFVERDPGSPLARRALAEGAGTAFLMFIATALGLAAAQIFVRVPGVAVMASAMGVAGALTSLIIALGEVSGGHFNPLITGLQWLSGERSRLCSLTYVGAQILGAIFGALVARTLYGDSPGVPRALSWQLGFSELIVTFGLMTVVFGCSRGRKATTGPLAVGGWIGAAFIAAPSRCYANPAIAVGAVFAAGPIALSPVTAAVFVLSELAGALGAFAVIETLYPIRAGFGASTGLEGRS